MASNHGNLEKYCYLPWFKGLYGVHAKVNDKEGGTGENKDGNGYGNGERGLEGTERGGEQQIEEAGASGGGRGEAAKTGYPSVGNVYSYRTAYKWEGANYIQHLQH